MNSLSLLIYLVSVVSGLGTFLGIVSLVLLAIAGLCILIGLHHNVPSYNYNSKEERLAAEKAFQKKFFSTSRISALTAFGLLFLSVFVPSRSTMII